MVYYAAYLNLRDRKCVVVGGGAVAERKVRALLECEASVTVISPELSPGLGLLRSQADFLLRLYQEGDLEGAFLAIAATDDREVNRQVAGEARRKGVLVNVVDDPDYCDFIVPSVVRRGELSVAISTGGRSPALARKVREALEAFLGPEYEELLALLAEARQQYKGRVPPEGWQQAASAEVLGLLRRGEREAARARIAAALSRSDLPDLPHGDG